jgi:hypothetical protein
VKTLSTLLEPLWKRIKITRYVFDIAGAGSSCTVDIGIRISVPQIISFIIINSLNKKLQ